MTHRSPLPGPHSALSTRFNPWPLSIIAFFTLAVLACAGFIVFCSRHPADLVAADYYEQEIRYQSQMDRVRHAQQSAQPASVAYDPSARRITVSFPEDHSITNVAGTIHLYRPSDATLDRQLKLEPGPSGVQIIDATGLLPGLWKVRVSWTLDRQDYFLDQQVVIQ